MHTSRNLDVLRAMAVSMVVLCHLVGGLATQWRWAWVPRTHLAVFGRVGVALFFVHTTLVLMMSMGRGRAQTIPFFVRRLFRIYPLSITVVLILAWLKSLGGVPMDGASLLSNLALIQNITGHDSSPSVLWSLPYEVQMYLALPALFLLARQPHPVARVAGVLAASAASLVLLRRHSSGMYELLKWAPAFIPGVLAFVLPHSARRSPALLFGLAAAGAVAVPCLVAAGWPEVQLMWALCLALGLAIPACREIEAGRLAHTAQLVATHSYAIYLTHMLAIAWGLALFGAGHWSAALVGCVGFMALMAVPAYRFVERPGMAVGAAVANRLQTSSGKSPVLRAGG